MLQCHAGIVMVVDGATLYAFCRTRSRWKIQALHRHAKAGTEELPPHAPEVVEFLEATMVKSQLTVSDLTLVRVLEDLIELLLVKGVITLTDLPDAAIQKLKARHRIREKFTGWGQPF